MAITRYVPPIKKIVDRRKPEGGYYVATCEVCGTTYYPERSNSKYCTPKCGLISHRMAVANGTATKRAPKKEEKKVNVGGDTIRGAKNVYELLKSTFGTYGDREYILSNLSDLDVYESFEYKSAFITKLSAQVYIVENGTK